MIDSPVSGVVVGAGARTIAFTDADPTATYKLLREGPVGGACDLAPDLSAIVVDTAVDDTQDLVDNALLASGDWCYWVEGNDAFPPAADSATLLITVDVTPPAAPTGVTLSGSTPTKTAPSFTFTETGDPGDSYQLYRAGVAVGSPVAHSPIADPTSVPADGTYSYTVTAIDSLGNESSASSGVNVRFDNTAPSAPASFARSGPNPRKTAPAFTFSSSSDLSGPVTYQLYRDGVAVGTPDSGRRSRSGRARGRDIQLHRHRDRRARQRGPGRRAGSGHRGQHGPCRRDELRADRIVPEEDGTGVHLRRLA